MATQNYVIIDTLNNKCLNIISWDGVSSLMLGDHQITQVSNGSINVGDTVVLSHGVYIESVRAAGLSPASLFNVDKFSEDLLTAFSSDTNLFQYYAVLKDLAIFQNFTGMKNLTAELLQAQSVTQDEMNTLNAILATQNIVLSDF